LKGGRQPPFVSEGMFLGYRHDDRSPIKPLSLFGYGLSYTTFQYSNLQVRRDAGDVKVTFTIENTGQGTRRLQPWSLGSADFKELQVFR
jgi:hypothetical protein